MKLAVTCNIRPLNATSEHAEWDELSTIEAIRSAFEKLGHQVFIVDCHNVDIKKTLLSISPDFVFNIAEGLDGGDQRESYVPILLEQLKIPYTGSNPITLRNCLNKKLAKEILLKQGVKTPAWCEVDSFLEYLPANLRYPVIIKPLAEGSSKGIDNSCLLKNDMELREKTMNIEEFYLIEEFLPGREYTVALLGNKSSLRALPVVEIKLDSLPLEAQPVYGYEAKWIYDQPDNPLNIFECPANISLEKENEIISLAKETFNVLDCCDWARVDLREDSNGKVQVIEINPLPGIIPNEEDNSCFPKAARANKMNYQDILKCVLDEAIKRYGGVNESKV